MNLSRWIEKYFGAFLTAGLVMGLVYPLYNDFLMSLLKPFLMVMLLMVFLKTDIAGIFQQMKNYRYMALLAFLYMIVLPVLFYAAIIPFSRELALAALLLTAMPAGAATPALTDIARGNASLSASLVIITSMIAPFTIPLLFALLQIGDLSIDSWGLFANLSVIVFLPMFISQAAKKLAPARLERQKPVFTAVNILLLTLMVYAVIGSQWEVILSGFLDIAWKIVFLFVLFILLHVIGFLIGYWENKQGKIATIISAAYMNNSIAIVLASVYFEPSILLLMVLSELPWNFLLVPLRKMALRWYEGRLFKTNIFAVRYLKIK